MGIEVEPFTWRQTANPRPLSSWQAAPSTPGFYELGFMHEGRFEPKYGGRASTLPLRERLRQHWVGSHNPNVTRNRDKLWYRYRDLPTDKHARVVEALFLAAFAYDPETRQGYEWNRRHEWSQMRYEFED